MTAPRIRPADEADRPDIEAIVREAYRGYIARMGKPPGPMLDDYAARIAARTAWVIEEDGGVAGLIVLLEKPDHLLLDNVAIAPERQGSGLGRRLLAFAESEARRRGHREIRLYTHETMTENQRLYRALGYEETGRGTEAGFARVFMRKSLAGD
ncbi:MAG TPA: GNAT family N-acetyltransferase [Stellaceae bacterium]|nr:GNAT family N-acetyltransferase [Stellaceae bacterium]